MSIVSFKKTEGFTLIELLISISLGIVAVSAIMFFYISTITSSYSTLKASRLNNEISTLMALMANDIKRAGYQADTLDPLTNSFHEADTILKVSDQTIQVIREDSSISNTGNCITYSYDLNGSGEDDTDEYFGFRLNSNEVQMRFTNVDCSSDDWESITKKEEIFVSSLTFDVSRSTCLNTSEPDGEDQNGDSTTDDAEEYDCFIVTSGSDYIAVETWNIDIEIDAYLTEDSSIKVNQSQSVQVRNRYLREE